MDATLFKRITTLIDWLNAEVYEFLYPWIQYLMDVGGFPLVLGVVLIGGLVISIGSQTLRMMILSRPAKALGLSFKSAESSNTEFLHRFRRFHSKNVRNVMEGRFDETDVMIGDCHDGRDRHRAYFSFVAFGSDQLRIPEFSMLPEGLFDKALEGVFTHLTGEGDIDFHDHPQFSKQYRLTGPDETAIRQFFDSRLLNYFEAHAGWNVHAINGGIIFHRSSGRVHPKNLKKFLDEGLFMLQAFMHLNDEDIS